jgi:hypothetical protein
MIPDVHLQKAPCSVWRRNLIGRPITGSADREHHIWFALSTFTFTVDGQQATYRYYRPPTSPTTPQSAGRHQSVVDMQYLELSQPDFIKIPERMPVASLYCARFTLVHIPLFTENINIPSLSVPFSTRLFQDDR